MSLRVSARKKGMTLLFDHSGKRVPCTVLYIGDNHVICVKEDCGNGRMGSIRLCGPFTVPKDRLTKPVLGIFSRISLDPKWPIFESKVLDTSAYKVGQRFGVEQFEVNSKVDVVGFSKGCGHKGVMFRHGFCGGPGSHGSKSHRAGGSTGMRSTPGRVLRGTKKSGHTGAERVTVEGLRVMYVDSEAGVILVSGAVPGPNGGGIFVRHSVKMGGNASKTI